MARVKRGNVARQKRKKILKITKGFRGALSKLIRPAKQVVVHALKHVYEDRRRRKRTFRTLWIARLNAGVELQDLSYSRFIDMLKKKNILLNRKVLADIAVKHPVVFEEIVKTVKE